MRTPGIADTLPPQQGHAIAAAPIRKYAAEQVAHHQGRWRLRGPQRRQKDLAPMKTPRTADSPSPSRERTSLRHCSGSTPSSRLPAAKDAGVGEADSTTPGPGDNEDAGSSR